MRFELGDNYCLRSFLYGDAIALAKHGDNKEIARNLRDSFPNPYTLEHARVWIQYVKEYEAKTRFVIAHCDEAIGEIGFVFQTDIYRYSAEIGYWLSQEHWGKGLMSKALDCVTRYAFEQHEVMRLFAEVLDYNQGSCKVLEKCGYKLEGVCHQHAFKNDQFYDQFVYARIR